MINSHDLAKILLAMPNRPVIKSDGPIGFILEKTALYNDLEEFQGHSQDCPSDEELKEKELHAEASILID